MITILAGARIFDGYQFLENYAVLVKDGFIAALLPEDQLTSDMQAGAHRQELHGGVLAPGFIDLQVNGGGGVMFNNQPNATGIQRMLEGHRRAGTTSMTPTLISDTNEQLQAGVEAIQTLMGSEPGVLGVHIEGPFFNLKRRGTHKADYIRTPDETDFDWIIAAQQATPEMTVLLTLAPEQTPAGQITRLANAGILVCAGHTDADHEIVQRAINEGLIGFTHLYNAMRPLTGRDPGVVGAALADGETWCGIIADGHHVHPLSIAVAMAAKPQGKLYLVSDAMATVGSEQKSFTIYGETIREDYPDPQRPGRLVNADGNLAGSAIGLIDAVRYCVDVIGISLEEALRMASLYPAQLIRKSDNLGRIRQGYRADLVHFSDDYQVTRTWVAGESQTHF